MKALLDYISSSLGKEFVHVQSLSGGDISSAYLLETTTEKFFLKINSAPFALEMFQAEKLGLLAIRATDTIAVPSVYLVDEHGGVAFLLMEFVESKRPDSTDFHLLGGQLARFHQSVNVDFGFTSDGFIGSLSQSNKPHSNWAEFYWQERIYPQLKRALDARLISNRELPSEHVAMDVFQCFFGDVTPVLLHGDLWGGNFLISTDGTPYLIDPAVYYGHSMVDIAMTKLFGGFGAEFYESYYEVIPKPAHYEELVELYQLYYLLVHLNLFGSGYYSGVASILKRYF